MRPGTLLRYHALERIFKSELTTGTTILDIGGYDGFVSSQLLRLTQSINIAVIDIDEFGLQTARQSGLNALYASALYLPIPDNSIDVVLSLDLIEHIEQDEKLIEEISRVLKTEGKLILTTPCENGVSFPFLTRDQIEALAKQWGHVREGYSLEALTDLLNHYDLEIQNTTKYFNLLSRFAYWLNSLSNISLKGKTLLYRSLIHLEPYIKYRAQEHIIIAKKFLR